VIGENRHEACSLITLIGEYLLESWAPMLLARAIGRLDLYQQREWPIAGPLRWLCASVMLVAVQTPSARRSQAFTLPLP